MSNKQFWFLLAAISAVAALALALGILPAQADHNSGVVDLVPQPGIGDGALTVPLSPERAPDVERAFPCSTDDTGEVIGYYVRVWGENEYLQYGVVQAGVQSPAVVTIVRAGENVYRENVYIVYITLPNQPVVQTTLDGIQARWPRRCDMVHEIVGTQT